MLPNNRVRIVALAALMVLASAQTAEARWFEPQAHWWTSGRLCVGSRNPPARRWQALPPRSCGAAVQHVMLDVEDAANALTAKGDFAMAKQPTKNVSGFPPMQTAAFADKGDWLDWVSTGEGAKATAQRRSSGDARPLAQETWIAPTDARGRPS